MHTARTSKEKAQALEENICRVDCDRMSPSSEHQARKRKITKSHSVHYNATGLDRCGGKGDSPVNWAGGALVAKPIPASEIILPGQDVVVFLGHEANLDGGHCGAASLLFVKASKRATTKVH